MELYIGYYNVLAYDSGHSVSLMLLINILMTRVSSGIQVFTG